MNGIDVSITNFFKWVHSRPILKDIIITTGWSILGKAAGFLIPFFIAAWFGVSSATDAFFFAYGLTFCLSSIFAPVVESVIVPFIAEIKAKDETEVRTFLGNTLIVGIVGLALLGGLFIVISRPLLGYVTSFSQESLKLIFWLFVETMPLLVLIVGTSLLSGALNAYKVFWLPAISPAFRAVIILFVVLIFKDKIGVHSIAIGYVAGEVFRLLILLNEVTKRRILSFNISIELNPKFFKFIKTSFYQVIGTVVLAFNPIVDKTMGSWLGPGNVSILEYADRLYQIPSTLIGYGLFVVLLSHWSDEFYQGNEGVFMQKVIYTAKLVGILTLSLSFILFLMRQPLVNLVYGHGDFPVQYLSLVAAVWSLYLIGLAPTIVGLVFVRAHIVEKNTKFLMVIGIINFILNIILNLLLIRPIGVFGLALSTTITYSISAAILFFFFVKDRSSNNYNNTEGIKP